MSIAAYGYGRVLTAGITVTAGLFAITLSSFNLAVAISDQAAVVLVDPDLSIALASSILDVELEEVLNVALSSPDLDVELT